MFFSKKEYKTLNLIKINKRSLLENFFFFQKQNPQAKICPVLKSNAYGHGLKLIGKFVDQEIKPEFICVDSLYEAYELEKINIKTPILILGYTFPENFKYKKIDFRIPVFDPETLKILNKYQPGIKVHIKADTGMNRLGVKEKEIGYFIDSLLHCCNVKVEGIFSHLADADNKDESFSRQQIIVFKRIIKKFENAGFKFKYKHVCATGGSLKFKDPEFNLIRLGLGFYQTPQPALKLVSHIVDIKEIEKNETVGYSCTFTAKKRIKIAVLPIGYYDGVDRRLSNKGGVSVGSKLCPVIGRVCMNITMVDISNAKNAKVGDEVIVYDNNLKSPNNIVNTAKIIDSTPYEVLINLSETTRRILV